MAVHVLDRGGRTRRRGIGAGFVARVRHIDVVLIGTTLLLTVIGLATLYSASRPSAVEYGLPARYYLDRQIVYALLGVGVMVVCSVVDYRRIEEWGYWIYGAVVFSLLIVLSPIGHSTQNVQRWISFGPIQLQPSEPAVLGLIIVVACYIARQERALRTHQLVVILGLAALPMLLVVKQPDLGTGIVMGVVLALVLIVGGLRMRYVLAIISLVGLAFFCAAELNLLNGYQISRLSCFLHQNSTAPKYSVCSYELDQAKTAIGSGGATGVGYLRGQVTNLGYVPVAYADFVFSALGEQFGFLGCAGVLGLFGVLVLRVTRAAQMARDMLGRLLCIGVLGFVAFSVFQNVGMNVGITPITGIPFPFFSYGGSAMLAFYAGIGLVNNIEMRRGSMR